MVASNRSMTRTVADILRKVLGVFLLVAYGLAVAMAKIGGFILKSRNLLLYGALIMVSIFVPEIGIFLVGCLFMWLNRRLWNPSMHNDPR